MSSVDLIQLKRVLSCVFVCNYYFYVVHNRLLRCRGEVHLSVLGSLAEVITHLGGQAHSRFRKEGILSWEVGVPLASGLICGCVLSGVLCDFVSEIHFVRDPDLPSHPTFVCCSLCRYQELLHGEGFPLLSSCPCLLTCLSKQAFFHALSLGELTSSGEKRNTSWRLPRNRYFWEACTDGATQQPWGCYHLCGFLPAYEKLLVSGSLVYC